MESARSDGKPTQDEETIAEIEKTLGFNMNTSLQNELILKKYTQSSVFKATQLLGALQELRANHRQVFMHSTPVGKFYQNFQNEEDQYDVFKIVLVGILLGQGSPTEKMAVMFEHYDTEETNICTKELFT